MRLNASLLLAIALAMAVFGWNPFTRLPDRDAVLAEAYSYLETGVVRQANGVYRVRTLTRMPGVKAQDRKSTRLNSSHSQQSRMPSSA